MLLKLLLPLAVIVLISMPLVPVFFRKLTGKKAKYAIITNLCAFGGVMLLAFMIPIGNFAFAEEAVETVAQSGFAMGMKYLAAAAATGLSSLAAGIAVAGAAPAAIGAVSEDGQNFVKSLIFVALGEGCAIYGLLISILILNG